MSPPKQRWKIEELVKPANPLVEVIGETLERIHTVPSDSPHLYAGYKSIVLCFGNGKSIHLDAEMHLCKDGVFPVVRSRDGDWEMVKAELEESPADSTTLDSRKITREIEEIPNPNIMKADTVD